MSDEVIREFPLKGKLFTREYQPEPGLSGKGRRMQTMLRDSFLNVYDRLGAEAWLQQFVQRSDENARVFVNGLLRMVPLEAQGNADSTLIVKVISQVGPPIAVDITRAKRIREDVVTPPAPPIALEHDRAPHDPHG